MLVQQMQNVRIMSKFEQLVTEAVAKAQKESDPFTPSHAQYIAALQPIVDLMLVKSPESIRAFVAGTRAGTYAAWAIRMYKEQRPGYIRNEFGRVANEAFIKKAFGIKGKKLPPDEFPMRRIQGVYVWIEPARDPQRDARGKLVKSSRHRVMCRCPNCGDVVSVGRLAQHLCKSDFEHY